MTADKSNGKGQFVLVVDDEEALRFLAREELMDEGFQVMEASNGIEALDLFEKKRPNLILLDLVMPKMNGFSFCQHLRMMPGGRNLPVVVVTGAEDLNSIEKAFDAGATDFVVKPINWPVLSRHIRFLLRASETIESLRQSEAYNKRLINAIPDTILKISRDLLITDFRASCKLSKFLSGKKALNKTVTECMPQEIAELFVSHMEEILTQGGVQYFQFQYDDSEIDRHCEARLVKVGEEEVLGILRDVTDQKRKEEEIIQTSKLESMGLLAGGIAHDFNNILSGILGNLSLAKAQIISENELYENIQGAETAAIRAKDLVQRLLTFSKGKKPTKRIMSLSQIIQGSAELSLRGSNVNYEMMLSDDVKLVEIDDAQITQVFQNLFINADQAMADGGTIKVQAQNVVINDSSMLPLKPGAYVKVSIKDQGCGISENHLKYIFDPYFTTKEKGSGLGLATAYSIAVKHGGHLAVETRLGKGSTFHFYIPASEKTEVEVEDKEEESVMLGQGRILVMDDEELVRNTAARILTHLGYKADLAEDGESATEKYRLALDSDRPYDAVILDLTISGGMGGKAAVKRLKELDPNVIAIVSSGYSNDRIISNYKEHGFKGMIAKPYRIEEFSRILHDIVALKSPSVHEASDPSACPASL
ncbi:response regulator [Acidobacteriota bacterium]